MCTAWVFVIIFAHMGCHVWRYMHELQMSCNVKPLTLHVLEP